MLLTIHTILTQQARSDLDVPLTLNELRKAGGSFPTCKAPGDDGIPMEVYTQYGKVILPKLLKVLNASLKVEQLPMSMSNVNVILLLKPGKDPVDRSSYRPISLLQSDVKIVAKVLSLRVNQAGFMPRKSTATNLRRLFLNMQTLADNTGQRALLSLDANKAFDSVSWRYLWAVLTKFGFGTHFIAWTCLLYSSPQVAI